MSYTNSIVDEFIARGVRADVAIDSDVVDLPIIELHRFELPARLEGEDLEHVRRLAESAEEFPPIIVHRPTMQVIDGTHRLHATRMRGRSTIRVVFYEGSVVEAFVLAVWANTAHGLPLSLADRKAAATRILSHFPDWSDRAIATVAGISPKTVSAIRRKSAAPSSEQVGRIARNGVLHRSSRGEGRKRAAELLAKDPYASIREIADTAGISVTTAKDVRRRLKSGEDPLPVRDRPADRPPIRDAGVVPKSVGALADSESVNPIEALHRLRKDPSLRFNVAGRRLLSWLEILDGADWPNLAGTIPQHCVPSVADLARQCSKRWEQLATRLDQQKADC